MAGFFLGGGGGGLGRWRLVLLRGTYFRICWIYFNNLFLFCFILFTPNSIFIYIKLSLWAIPNYVICLILHNPPPWFGGLSKLQSNFPSLPLLAAAASHIAAGWFSPSPHPSSSTRGFINICSSLPLCLCNHIWAWTLNTNYVLLQ